MSRTVHNRGSDGPFAVGDSVYSSQTIASDETQSSPRGATKWIQPDEGRPFIQEPSFVSDMAERTQANAVATSQLDNRTYYTIWFLLWTLGLINNFGYVIVSSAAKSVADGFDQGGLIGLVQWANVALGLLAKFLNTAFFLNYSYTKRIILNTVFMGGGMVLTAAATKINFVVAIIGISFIGTSSALGESVLLGFIKNYDPMLTGAWSSGTGGAGVLGALSYLLLSSIWKLTNFTIFCILAPLSAIYFAAFIVLFNKYHHKNLYGAEAPHSLRMTRSRNSSSNNNAIGNSLSYRLLADEPINQTATYDNNDLTRNLRVITTGDAAAAASTRKSYHSQTGGQLIDSPTFRAAPSTPSTPASGPISDNRSSQMPYRLPSPPSLPASNNAAKNSQSKSLTQQNNSYVNGQIGSDDDDDDDDDLRNTMARALGVEPETTHAVAIAGSPALLTDNALLAAQRRASHAIDPTMFSVPAPNSDSQQENVEKDSVNYGSLLSSSFAANSSDMKVESNHRADKDVVYATNEELVETDSALSEVPGVKEPVLAKFKRILPQVWTPAILLALVYFFEYVAAGEFASKANPGSSKSKNWWKKKSFEILSFCYQVGVLISRSSISFVKIKRIDIICAVQGVMFIIWMIQALKPFMSLGVQFASMIFIGLLGGGMYVNVFHALAENTTIAPADKEFGINIVSFFINLGIMIAGFFGIFADHVFLPKTEK